jgi:hypothetical protein
MPEVIHFIKNIISVEPYKVVCLYNTGEVREIDMKKMLEDYAASSTFFKPLLKAEYFKSVKLDSYGTLSWDNEIDFCPDVLYQNSKAVI